MAKNYDEAIGGLQAEPDPAPDSLPGLLRQAQEYQSKGEHENAAKNLLAGLERLRLAGVKVDRPEKQGFIPPSFPDAVTNRAVREGWYDFFIEASPALKYVALHCEYPSNIKKNYIRVGLIGYFDDNGSNPAIGTITSMCDSEELEIILFHVGKKEGVSEDLKQKCTVIFLGEELEQARKTIAEQEVDMVVYLDCSRAFTYFLAFARLAPIQVINIASGGFTSGIKTIDYALSVQGEENKSSQNEYSEKLVKLKTANEIAAKLEEIYDEDE